MSNYINIKDIYSKMFLINHIPLKKIFDGYGSDINNRLQNTYEFLFRQINEAIDQGLFEVSIKMITEPEDESRVFYSELRNKIERLGYTVKTKHREKEFIVRWSADISSLNTEEKILAIKKTHLETSYPTSLEAAKFTMDTLIEHTNEITAAILGDLSNRIIEQLLYPPEERIDNMTIDLSKPIIIKGVSNTVSMLAAARVYKILQSAEELGFCTIDSEAMQKNFFEQGFIQLYKPYERFKFVVPDIYQKIKIRLNRDYVYHEKPKNDKK